jgi:stearoyl-CoA desaturase (delta-9 desaturase)
MTLVPGSERILAGPDTDPVQGRVRWAPAKSLWIGSMTLAAVLLGPPLFRLDAFVLFIATSAITLCFGHSVGMHRRLIHRSFDCPLWLEHTCVYLGTLVGMAGPIGMIRLHDFRDWAQRQKACHDYSAHRATLWHDAWWQMHCRLDLLRPPLFRPEPRIAGDRFYAVVERTWMWQQLPWAVRPDLHRRGGGGARIQCRNGGPDQHGGVLAQQSPCLPGFGPDGPVSRPDRSRLVADQDFCGARPRLERQDA